MSLHFCNECGKPLQSTDAFCMNCGERFESQQQEQMVPNNQTSPPKGEPQKVVESNQPGMSKKKKTIIGIIAVILIALFFTHTYIKSMITSDKQMVLIYEALHEGNGEKFLDAVHVDDDVIVDPKVYMEALTYEEPSYLFKEIETAIQQVENTNFPQFITSSYIGDFLKVEKESYLWIYKKVKITALAFEAKIETDLPGGKAVIGDNEWALEGESIHLGRFLPGDYSVLLTSKEPTDSSEERGLSITSDVEDNVLVLNKDMYMVSLAQENKDSQLIIDGKETGKKVSEMLEIGPLFTQDPIELNIVKEVDGKKQESLVEDAYPGNEVSFIFEDEEEESDFEGEIIEEVERLVLDFRSAYEDALNERDFSLVAPFLEKGSLAYEELAEYVGDLKNENYQYDFTHNETTKTEVTSDRSAVVDSYEVFDFTNHKGHVTNYKREKTYYIIFDRNEEFKITNIEIGDTTRE